MATPKLKTSSDPTSDLCPYEPDAFMEKHGLFKHAAEVILSILHADSQAWLQASHGYGAGAQAAHIQTALSEPETFYASPMEVVYDPVLAPGEKRAVLKNWAWNEYLIDLATAEGMPENARPSRLDEAELALLALEARNRGFQTGTSPVRSRIAA